jgi:long-chain acyl-CoA synthetase
VEFYLNKSDCIQEVVVWGFEDEKTGDTVVQAEIFPDYSAIEEKFGKISGDELRRILKKEIDGINEHMPLYKRVKRFEIREEEFEKTTTRKIKRHTANHG